MTTTTKTKTKTKTTKTTKKKITAAQAKIFEERKKGRQLKNTTDFKGKRTKNNIPDFGNCKYYPKNNKKDVHYGVQECYSDNSEKSWVKDNQLIIEDAITGEKFRVPLDICDVEKIQSKWGPGDRDEYNNFIRKEWEKACKVSDDSSTLKNKIFNVGVADGMAWYIILKETKTNVYVEWRGFDCGDRYVDRMLGYQGKYPKKMIEQFVDKIKFSESASRGTKAW